MKAIASYSDAGNESYVRLLEAITRMEAAHEEAAAAWKALEPEIERSSANYWAPKVEAALDQPEEMEELKVLRREGLIQCEAAILRFQLSSHAVAAARERLIAAGSDLLFYHQRLRRPTISCTHDYDRDATFFDMHRANIECNLVMANELCVKQPAGRFNEWDWIDENISAPSPLYAAFHTLADSLESWPHHRKWPTVLLNLYQRYPRGNVVPSFGKAPPSEEFVWSREMRRLDALAFVSNDVPGPEYPDSEDLATLLQRIPAMKKRVQELEQEFKTDPKGKVNEPQHRKRMVAILDGVRSAGQSGQELLDGQKPRRLAYQSARLALYAAVTAADDLRCRTIKTLVLAIEEIKPRLPEFEQESVAQARGRWSISAPCKSAIVNCLAADVIIRHLTAYLLEVHRQFDEDITEGAGAREVGRTFAEAKGYFSRGHRFTPGYKEPDHSA